MSALVREREHTEAEWVDGLLADAGRVGDRVPA